jgi:hypothetical protein
MAEISHFSFAARAASAPEMVKKRRNRVPFAMAAAPERAVSQQFRECHHLIWIKERGGGT